LTEQQRAIPFDDNKIAELGSRNPFSYFHIKLVESTGNNWLIRFYHTIAPTLARYQFMCYIPEILSKVQEEHEVLFDLIKNGEYGSAKRFLKRHIDWHVKFIEHTLRKSEGKGKAGHVGM
jgi:DNA-binding GntR family transcriptional regulator